MRFGMAFMVTLSVTVFTSQSLGWVLVIDPGHGGPEASQFGPNGDGRGTCGPLPDPMSEEWVNLQVGLRMKSLAINDPQWAVTPMMTRETDTTRVRLQERIQKAKNFNADYFLSIHHNGDTSLARQGTEVFWSDSASVTWGPTSDPDSVFSRSTNSRDSVYAMKVLLRLIGAWGYTNRCDVNCGKPDCMRGCDESRRADHKWVLNHSHSPYCALSEASFITNYLEEWKFLNDWSTNHISQEAEALYVGTRSHWNKGGIAQLCNSYVGGPGDEIAIDGLTYTTPIQFAWEVGEQHNLQAKNLFLSGGYYYYFHHWAHLDPSFHQPTETHYTTDWYVTVPGEFDFHIYRAYYTGGPYECAIWEPCGDETYGIGDTLQILYTCDVGVDSTSQVDVYLDRHHGHSGYPETIAQNVPYADGVRWVINGPESDSCLMKVVAHDFLGNSVSAISEYGTFKVHTISSGCTSCGDANDDGGIDISDAVFLVAYIFSGCAAPHDCSYANGMGDANGDGGIDISDAVYLICYIFSGCATPHCL
jgi:N-acetylmuramoyl-L-alanine amidase